MTCTATRTCCDDCSSPRGATDKVFGDDAGMIERNEESRFAQTRRQSSIEGKDSIGSFKFIRDIREQTLANGDDRDEDDIDERQVRLLVGNHELMAIQADYRFMKRRNYWPQLNAHGKVRGV